MYFTYLCYQQLYRPQSIRMFPFVVSLPHCVRNTNNKISKFIPLNILQFMEFHLTKFNRLNWCKNERNNKNFSPFPTEAPYHIEIKWTNRSLRTIENRNRSNTQQHPDVLGQKPNIDIHSNDVYYFSSKNCSSPVFYRFNQLN